MQPAATAAGGPLRLPRGALRTRLMNLQAPPNRSMRRRPSRSSVRRAGARGGALPPASSRPDDRLLLSNLPDQLPVTPDEMNLVRSFFADLINAALKGSK